MYKTDSIIKQNVRDFLPYKIHLRGERYLEKIKSRSLFGYVQCDFEVSGNLRELFANFLPFCKNNKVDRDDIGPLLREYAEKEGLLTQPRRMLTSS